MVKAIIFDFAGVIGADGYWAWLRENVQDIENQKSYFQELSEKVDKGLITNRGFVDALSQKTSIDSLLIWPAIFEKIVINQELLDYIKKLKKNYKIGLLSNFTFEWLDEIFEKYNLSSLFDAEFISSKFKIIKPEAEAFHKVLELLGVSKEEAVFVDDRQGHVDAANALGIRAFLFTTNKNLKVDFENYGIKA